MADNYLERKMEEHRNGGSVRKPVRKVAAAGNLPGVWRLPYAERRVLLLGDGSALDRMISEQLRSTGCKVAFMGGDKGASTELARRIGAQFHPVDYDCDGAMRKSVALICRAWGDIDAVVSTIGVIPSAVLEALRDYRADKPYPNPFGGRIVMLAPAEMPSGGMLESLRGFGISAAMVEADNDIDRAAAALLAINYNVAIQPNAV